MTNETLFYIGTSGILILALIPVAYLFKRYDVIINRIMWGE